MVDAYQDITIPFQMASKEFFTLVKDHLTDDGVMVVNMNMRGSKEGSINDYLADTISSVFSEVYTTDVIFSTNRELFASNNSEMLDLFIDGFNKEADSDLNEMMSQINEQMLKYNPGNYLMTDDKAPVELLSMKVIDEIIADEVSYYKGIYEKGGIDALLRVL